jgi:glutamyl-tRNA reductase
MNELERALRKVRNGDDPSIVAEEMAHRITQKFLHPILKELTKENDHAEEVQQSRELYEKTHPKGKRR